MKRNLLHIIFSNVIYTILVASTNFILPKFTSIDTYAAIKEYTLYITTYTSILTLGYIQGMYIKYGGKKVEQIEPKLIGTNVISFFVFMLPISMIISIIGCISNNFLICIVGLGILTTNMITYYQMLYQATGEFKSYGIALNASRIMMFAIDIFLIFIAKTDNKYFYVLSAPLVGIIISIYLTYKLNKRIPIFKGARVSALEMKSNIHNGFILMLGNFVTSFFSSIDRWFIKFLMETAEFAMYSFSVSMENIVNTFMTPITVSMYNYLCKRPKKEDVIRIKNATLIYSFIIIAAAFPAKWFLENFMQKYLGSTVVIFPLFAAQGIATIIKGIYINKYKAEGKQKKYLFQMIGMLTLAILLNIVLFAIFKDMQSIAVATLLTNIIWLIICEFEAREIRFEKKAILSIAILLIVYIVTGYNMNSILGCFVYCFVGLIIGLTLMRESFLYVSKSIFNTIKSKLCIGVNQSK